MKIFGMEIGGQKIADTATAAVNTAKQVVSNAANTASHVFDMNKINMAKDHVINLMKTKGIGDQKAQIVLCLDISGSMETMYLNGEVQKILERVTPIAMGFDDDQAFQLYLFENGVSKHHTDISVTNLQGVVSREILGHYRFGGTNYAPAINRIVQDYTKGTTPIVPVYVVFLTDGENSDHEETRKALINASRFGVFFQFVGIGRASFSFLQELDNMQGRVIDNANFFSLNDFNSVSDEKLYGELLGEFPSWLPLAKAQGQI
jgi:hypothetical protein